MGDARHLVNWLVALLKRGGLWWSLGISVGAAVVSLAAATAVVVAWPPDRFKGEGPTQAAPRRSIVIHVLGSIGKNVAGGVLILLGLVMSVPGVPGQGLLTMLIGLTLLSFPGKRRLERRFVQRPSIQHAINRLRARFHRPPLELD